jgi:membrane protease YdiL (CAAX protease family)
MYAAFYLWHGILSTDFYRIEYPKPIFLTLAGIVYFVISFVLYKIYELKFWRKITQNLFLRGVISGAVFGFLLFAIATVLGVGFSSGLSTKILMMDMVWQIIEQSIGGTIIALAHFFIFVPVPEEDDSRNF